MNKININEKISIRNNCIKKLINNKTKIYATLDLQNEEIEENEYLTLTLLTEEIIDYDNSVLKQNINNYQNSEVESLKPIFVSYILKEPNVCSRLPKGWFSVEIVKYEKERVTNNTLDGSIIVDAPFKIIDKKLIVVDEEIDDEILNRINKTYDIKELENNIVTNIDLRKIFNNNQCNQLSKIKVYKLGDANCNLISNICNKNIIYDMGYPIRKLSNVCFAKYSNSKKSISNIKKDIFIISHWDIDHYALAMFGNYQIYDKKIWIVNMPPKSNVNVIKMLSYIRFKSKLYIFNGSISPITHFYNYHNINYKFSICRGSGKTINDTGIYIALSGLGNIVLYGDVNYQYVLRQYLGLTNFLVAPHHGAKLKDSIMVNKAKDSNSIAVFSAVGSQLHPHKTHKKKLLNFKQYETHSIKKGFAYEYDIFSGSIRIV